MVSVKRKITVVLGRAVYAIYLHCWPTKKKINVMSADATLEQLETSPNLNLVRFGDGEVTLIRKKDTHFQRASETLRTELIRVARCNREDVLICLPDIFNGGIGEFWSAHLLTAMPVYMQIFGNKHTFGNASVTRLSVQKEGDACSSLFKRFFLLWKDKDVVIVEGENSRNGVGNDMFSQVHSLQRILAPQKQAYDRVEQLYEATRRVLNNTKDVIVLLSLGPTAKILAMHLIEDGYRVLDIGNLDMSYSHYLMTVGGHNSGFLVKGKYILEAQTDDQDLSLPEELLRKYESEIAEVVE